MQANWRKSTAGVSFEGVIEVAGKFVGSDEIFVKDVFVIISCEIVYGGGNAMFGNKLEIGDDGYGDDNDIDDNNTKN